MPTGSKTTTDQFISMHIFGHGDKYLYDQTEYTKAQSSVIITCPTHGHFTQRACAHLRGHGCRKCGRDRTAIAKLKDNETFIGEAVVVHGDRYDYSDVNYTSSAKPVSILCRIHGEFRQKPSNHLSGQGCPQCAIDASSKRYCLGVDEFIRRSSLLHDNKYDYSFVKYVTNNTKVDIVCPIHGVFSQAPAHHMNGCGCTECGNFLSSMKREEWVKKSNNKLGIFYIIRCFNENESFFKYGITFNTLKSRYSNKKRMPYEYEIVRLIMSSDKGYIWDLEKRFGRLKRPKRYSPLIKFQGYFYECFK